MVRVVEAEADWTDLLRRADAGEDVVVERLGQRSVALKVIEAELISEPPATGRWARMTVDERMAWLDARTVDLGYEFDATAAIREDRDAKNEHIARMLGR